MLAVTFLLLNKQAILKTVAKIGGKYDKLFHKILLRHNYISVIDA